MTISLKKILGGLVLGAAFASQAVAAVAPTFLVSGDKSHLVLNSSNANKFDVTLPTGFSLANATYNTFLSLSSAADLVFTFVGKEAAYNDVFKDYNSKSELAGTFSNSTSVGNTSMFTTTNVSAGSLTFGFLSNAVNNSFYSNGSSRIGVILSDDKKSALLMFNDKGSDKDYDDMVVKVSILSAVPEPETYALMLGGLALVSAVARRRKQQA